MDSPVPFNGVSPSMDSIGVQLAGVLFEGLVGAPFLAINKNCFDCVCFKMWLYYILS